MAAVSGRLNDTHVSRHDAESIGATLLWASHHRQNGAAPVVRADAVPALAEAASFHRVGPTVYDALKGAAASGASSPLLQSLNATKSAAIAQHLHALADLPGLIRTFEDIGVPWAMMKGPVVAELGYGDPALRGYADLDVLIRPRDLTAVIDALLAGGARLRTTDWAWAARSYQCEIGLLLRYGNVLDLHWHPVNRSEARATTNFEVDVALAAVRTVSVAPGIVVPALDAVDNLLMVAVHAAWSGGHILGWVKDLERLMTLDPCDWDEVVRRARRARIAVPVALMLRRASRLLGAPVPDSIVANLVVGHRWSILMFGMERLASPRALGRRRRTAQGVVASARDSAGHTARAVADEMETKLRGVTRIPTREQRRPPEVDESALALRSYLDAVTNGTWTSQPSVPIPAQH